MKHLQDRLQQAGVQTLSTEELLSLSLGSSHAEKDLHQKLVPFLANGLRGVMRTELGEMCESYGLSLITAIQVQVILELARRLNVQSEEKYQIHGAEEAAKLVMAEMTHLDYEQIRIVTLDTKHCVLTNTILYQGTLDASVVRVAEVFRLAITRKAASIILFHNHPSGNPVASPEDIEITMQVVNAGKLLEIELLDHIIIGDNCFKSLRESLRW